MLVCCLGDSVLDVMVSVEDGLAPDDDVPATITVAAGGQAANVAAWVRAAGADARFLGPRSDDAAGALLEQALTDRGIELSAPPHPGRAGAVVSVISGGRRSMASDAGELGWPPDVLAHADLSGADWLLVSGYALYRAPEPEKLVTLADRAIAQHVRVGVDLASAGMLTAFGPQRTADLVRRMSPTTVFANVAEWDALTPHLRRDFDLVLKQGARGCTFTSHTTTSHATVQLPSRATEVVDPTGAGDALAAGYLVGGPELAMTLAARCVAHLGAQPTGSG